MLAYVCCYVYIRWGRYVHIGVGSWVARFDYNGQFLGPQAVERVTDRVSTSFFLYRCSQSFNFNRILGGCRSDIITIKRKTYLLFSVLLIFIGELIYILYRPLTLYMFKPFEQMGMLDCIRDIRASHLFPPIEAVPQWIVYNLPDGMWLLSYMFAMEFHKHQRTNKRLINNFSKTVHPTQTIPTQTIHQQTIKTTHYENRN